MKRAFAFLLVVFLATSISVANPKAYADKWEDLVTESAKVLNEVNSMPDTSIPSDLFKKCKAIAIFPSTVGGGFIFLAIHAVFGELVKHSRSRVLLNFGAGILLIAALNLVLRFL